MATYVRRRDPWRQYCDAVPPHDRVGGHEAEVLHHRLRDEHAVERVSVMRRQRRSRARVPTADRQLGEPARMSLMEQVLATLRDAPFPSELLDLAFHTLQNHVLGHALQAVTFGMDADDVAAGARQFLARLDVDTYPEMAAHVRWHVEGRSDGDDAFGFGLGLILDGLERARDVC